MLVSGLSQSRIVYLDTNYWVWLRDAERGTGTADAVRMLKMLRGMVRSRELVCVSQLHSLVELAKQEEASLRITAGLVDELTEGIAIAAPADLMAHDCAEFIDAKLGLEIGGGFCPWTKIGQIHTHDLSAPLLDEATESDKNVVLKAAVDTFWNASLADVMESFKWDARTSLNADIDPAIFAQIEQRKREQLARGLSREQTRANEFYDVVHDRMRPVFKAQLAKWHAQHGFSAGPEAPVRDVQLVVDSGRRGIQRAYAGTLSSDGGVTDRALHAVRNGTNRSKPLTSNDNVDWNHASNALAHCDIIFD